MLNSTSVVFRTWILPVRVSAPLYFIHTCTLLPVDMRATEREPFLLPRCLDYSAVNSISLRCRTNTCRHGYFYHCRTGISGYLDSLVFLPSLVLLLGYINSTASSDFLSSLFLRFYYSCAIVLINYSATQVIIHRDISMSDTSQSASVSRVIH